MYTPIRPLLLICSVLLSSIASTQVELGEFHTVKINSPEKAPKGHYFSQMTTIPVGDVILQALMISPQMSRGTRHELTTYDRNTGAVLVRNEQEWPQDRTLEKVMDWDGNILVTSYGYDHKEKQLDLFIQVFDAATLEEKVAATNIGRLSLASYTEGYKLGLRFAVSPDDNKLLMFYDRIRTKDEQQLVICWVLDRSTGNIWSGGYPMDVESDVYATTGFLVDDEGAVHMASRQKVKFRREGQWITNHSYSIYRFQGEEKVERKFDLPEGKVIVGMTLIQDKGKVIGAGFLANDARNKETTDVFKMVFSPGAEAGVDLDVHRLSSSVPGSISNISTAIADDGTLFVTGGDRRFTPSQESDNVVACAIDDSGLRYSTLIPRKPVLQYYSNPEHLTVTDGSTAIVLLPDHQDNLEAYRSGGKLKENKDHEVEVVQVTFDPNGRPTYSRLALPGFKVLYDDALVMPDQRTVYFNYAKEQVGKKETVNHKLFWSLK